MLLTIALSILGTLLALVVIGLALRALERRAVRRAFADVRAAQALAPGDEGRKLRLVQAPAPVIAKGGPGECATCAHFDVKRGQLEMQRNPAFVRAAQMVPPWRMGRALKTVPNPVWHELHDALELARLAGDLQKVAALDAKLDTTPNVLPMPDLEQVEDARLLSLDWADMGACHANQEIRAPIDKCPSWVARRTSVSA